MDIITFVSQQWILIILLIGLIALYAWVERQKGGKLISAVELVSLMNNDRGILLDVRAHKEFQANHIHGAINIPHNKVTSQISELEKYRDKIVVVTDQIGQYAGSVGKTLTKDNYVVRRLQGGISEWQGQNMPMVRVRSSKN